MSEKQVRDYDKFMLRFPDGMRAAIADRAKTNGRSMNAEIVQILEDALACSDDGMHDLDLKALREVIAIQAGLLEKYNDIISRGSETLDEITQALKANKKPT